MQVAVAVAVAAVVCGLMPEGDEAAAVWSRAAAKLQAWPEKGGWRGL